MSVTVKHLPGCFLLLIESSGTKSCREVVTLTATLLVLVEDQLLQPLLLVPAVQMGLHRHLDLLLLHLGCGAGYRTVHVTTNPCKQAAQAWATLVSQVLPLHLQRGIRFGSLYPSRFTKTSPFSSGNEILTVVRVKLQG